MARMTEPHHAVIARLSADFAAISHQLARVSADLTELDRVLSQRPRGSATGTGSATRAIRSARGAVHPASGAVLAVSAASAGGAASSAFGTAPPSGRGLDRQGARRRRRRGHAHRCRAAAGAGRAGRHSAPRDPRRCGRWWRSPGRHRCWLYRATGWTSRCDRPGRHRRRGGLHGRHRRHHDLRLGLRARRPGDRRGHRWRRPDPGPTLGFRASRAAGAGAADRPGAGRHRRHHPAARRVHAGAVGGRTARAARQGLDLAARRPDGGRHVSAAGRAGRFGFRFRRRPVARRGVRHRRGARDRRRADPAAANPQPGRDGAADGGGCAAGAVRVAGRRPGDRRPDGRRAGRGPARDRVPRRSVARCWRGGLARSGRRCRPCPP